KITMVCNKPKDAGPGCVDQLLRNPHKFNVIVLQPELALVEWLAIYDPISVHDAPSKRRHVGGDARIRRITYNDGEPSASLNRVNRDSFMGKSWDGELKRI